MRADSMIDPRRAAFLDKGLRLCLQLGLFLFMIWGLFGPVLAETLSSVEIALYPVHNDTPVFQRPKTRELGISHPVKMLKIRDNPIIKSPPDTSANVLYFGQVKLGYPPAIHGILFDLEGKTPQLWVDADGQGDYSSQIPQSLYKSDKYPGVNVYYAPAPLTFTVQYTFPDHTYQIPLRFELPYLIVAQAGFDDFCFLKTRTWFTGVIPGANDDIQIALVDTNDNGDYNDPDDLIFIDWNYDLNFTAKEGLPVKSCNSIKLPSNRKYKIDYTTAPETIILKKG
jgi:hypothetical protein